MSQAASTEGKTWQVWGWVLVVLTSFPACSSRTPETVLAPNSAVPTSNEANLIRPVMRKLVQDGPKINLLERIDVEKGAVKGNFRREGGLVVIPPVTAAQLNVDVNLPEQYMLEMDVFKTSTAPGSLNLGFWASPRDVATLIIDGWDRRVSAICRIDGQIGESNISTRQIDVFTDSRPRTVRITVRIEGVQVEVDGRLLVEFLGIRSRLSFDDRFFRTPRANQLMLGGWEAEFRVARWELTPLNFEQPESLRERQMASDVSGHLVGSMLRDQLPGNSTGNSTDNQTAGAPLENVQPRPAPPTPEVPSAVNIARAERKDAAPPAPSADGTPADDTRTKGSSPPSAPKSDWFEVDVPWQVEVDPYPGWDGSLSPTTSITYGAGLGCAPLGPSPFVMFSDNWDLKTRERLPSPKFSVYDLRKGKQVGVAGEVPENYNGVQLCPSGRYFATFVDEGLAYKATVRSFVTGQIVCESRTEFDVSEQLFPFALALNHTLVRVMWPDKKVQLQCFDLRTGQVRATYETGGDVKALQMMYISPGGRYAVLEYAYAHELGHFLDVIELATGKHVGRLRPPAHARFGTGGAFHRNGTEFACLVASKRFHSPMLWCVDWATGRTLLLASIHSLGGTPRTLYSAGPVMEWTADDDLLLYSGQTIIDRKSGRMCYQIPVTNHVKAPHRVLSRKLVLTAESGSDRESTEYRPKVLDKAAIDQAIDLVRTGATFDDLALPKLTNAQIDVDRVLVAPQAPLTPRLTPQARAAFPADRRIRLLQLDDFHSVIHRVEFADPPAAVAVGHFTVPTPDHFSTFDTLIRIDLKREEATSSIPIRKDFRLVSVSPDGAWAMVGQISEHALNDPSEANRYFRLDVLDLVRKVPVVGWRPYFHEPPLEGNRSGNELTYLNPRSVSWLRIIDRERIVTVNPLGKLVCWRIPDAQAIYRCDQFGTPLALSANRRYLVGADGPRLHLLDVIEGVWVGTLEFDRPPKQVTRAGFSSDQSELAVIVDYPDLSGEMVFFDLQTGKKRDSFPMLAIDPSIRTMSPLGFGIRHCGPGYWLVDNMYLVDCERRSKVWIYVAHDGNYAFNCPDHRMWYTDYERSTGPRRNMIDLWLAASPVPSDEVKQLLSSAGPGPFARPIGRSDLSLQGEITKKLEP